MKRIIFTAILITALGCSNRKTLPLPEKECFNSLEETLLNPEVTEVKFDKLLNCFEWDYMELGFRGSYTEHPDVYFQQIPGNLVLGKDLEKHMHSFDRDRNWQMIYFYRVGKILDQAIAVRKTNLSFENLTEKLRPPVFIYRQHSTLFIERIKENHPNFNPNSNRYQRTVRLNSL